MAVVMIPMHIRFVVCGELTIPHLGLIYYCFYKRKIAMRNLGKPSRSDFVQLLWMGNGFLLLYKRFEDGSLAWPRTTKEVAQLTEEQFRYLMLGLNPLDPKIKEFHPAKIS